MTNQKCYMLLGFDRVGKSSIIENSIEGLYGYSYDTYHFSAPKDKTNPLGMYYDFLRKGVNPYADYVFIDRGFPETVFFEQSRCGNVVNIQGAYDLMDAFSSSFIEFNLIIVCRDWEDILQAHIDEINEGVCDENSNETLDLETRKKEYIEYYDYMQTFWNPSVSPNIKWVVNQQKNYKLCLQS